MQEILFNVLRFPSTNPEHVEGDFHLLVDGIDQITPMRIINDKVGKPVVKLHGKGLGLHLIIDDMQAWSDYVSEHVEEIANNRFRLSLPDGPLQKRATK
jgi:hypothetical protein